MHANNLNNLIVPLALMELRHSMMSECDRANPDYLKVFAERSDANEAPIDLEDAAINAFFSMLDFPATGPLNAQAIDHAIKRTSSRIGPAFPTWKALNPAIETLCALREGSGWAELDKLLGLCSRPRLTWSHFYDSVPLIKNPDDLGLGGETVYRVMLMTHVNDFVSGVVDWFAVASDVQFLVPLLEMIEDGAYPPVDPHRPGPVVVTEIRLMKNEELMACLPVNDPLTSMQVDWKGFECLTSDASFYFDLIKALPATKSSLVKGKVLENAIL
jgi:hypothetical protein